MWAFKTLREEVSLVFQDRDKSTVILKFTDDKVQFVYGSGDDM